MTKFILVVLVLLSITVSASAQLPDAPSYNPKTFKAEAIALGAATALDDIATVRDTRMGIPEAGFPTGTAEIYGRHPQALKTTAIMFGISALTAYSAYRMEHSGNAFTRKIGHGLMIGSALAHGFSGIRDFRLQATR